MLTKLGAVFFMGFVVFFVLFIYCTVKDKGNATRNGMIAGCLIMISIVLVMAGSKMDLSDMNTLINRANKGNTQFLDDATTRKTYIDNSVGPFLKRTKDEMDMYWNFNLEEPLKRLVKDGDVDTFKSDAKRILGEYEGLMSEIDKFLMPAFFTDTQTKNAAELKTELFNAVQTRRTIARKLMDLKDAKDIIETDVSSAVEVSNQYLQAASEAFARMQNE